MDDLIENRMNLKEQFLENLSLGFRGLRKSLLNRLEEKSFKSVFAAIREIISAETESNLQGHQSLMRRLTANNSESLKTLIHDTLQLSVGDLAKQMLAAIQTIKELDKKIEKLFRKYIHKVGSKSKLSKLTYMEKELTQQWLVYKGLLHRQTVLLACLDEKLCELKPKLGQKSKRLLLKYVKKSRKLVRRFRGDSSNSSESGSSSYDSGIEKTTNSPKDEKNKSEPKKVVTKNKKVLRKILSPGLYRISPWPIGDPKGVGITPTRPINYEMFLASTGLVVPSTSAETNLSPSTSKHSVAGSTSYSGPTPKTIVVAPVPSVLTIHSLTSEEDAIVAPPGQEKPVEPLAEMVKDDNHVAITVPRSHAWEAKPVVETLAEMANVYTKVIKAYRPKDKHELKLKAGQIVKQKRPANQSGMAYGWIKNRVGLKKYGFYPVSHVVLSSE